MFWVFVEMILLLIFLLSSGLGYTYIGLVFFPIQSDFLTTIKQPTSEEKQMLESEWGCLHWIHFSGPTAPNDIQSDNRNQPNGFDF